MTLIAGLVISSFTINASNGSEISPVAVETENTIKEYFKIPQIINPYNEPQKVEVLFTTNLQGHVDFVLAKTLNQNLKIEIEKQFLKLNLTKIKSDVVHSVVLNIKTI